MIASERTNEMLGRPSSAAVQLPAWMATRQKMSAQGQSFCIANRTGDPRSHFAMLDN